MISGFALLSAALFGIVFGVALTFWFWVRILGRDPNVSSSFVAATLRTTAQRCNREFLHVRTCTGAALALSILDLARAIEIEMPLWVQQMEPKITPEEIE